MNIQKGDNELITYKVGSIVRVNDGNTTNISIVIKDFAKDNVKWEK